MPNLATLRFNIVESKGMTNADPKHSRIIVVERSPALFALACADPSCRDGGHDLTSTVMHGLLDGKTHFEMDQVCDGLVGTVSCGRNMHVAVIATYRSSGS